MGQRVSAFRHSGFPAMNFFAGHALRLVRALMLVLVAGVNLCGVAMAEASGWSSKAVMARPASISISSGRSIARIA